MKRALSWLLVCLLAVATTTCTASESLGQTADASAPALQPTPPLASSPGTDPTAQSPAAAPAAPDTVVIDYNEADLQNVIRTLATKAGVNLIVGDEVTGKVTVHLENVGYEDALRMVVESKGFAYVKDKNVARVKTKESLEAEPVEVQTYTLNYAKAEDVRKTLEPVLTRQGKVQVDTRSNTLVLSDTPSNLTKLMPLLEKLDTQTPQVMIEAKFVETTKNPKKDLGINWGNTLVNHEVSAGGSAISDDPTKGPKVIVDSANKPISGFQWVKSAGGSAITPWTAGVALLDAGRASLVFSFLSQDSDSELLANPRVVTTDNGKAKLAIATQYPIPTFTYSESKGAYTVSGFEYKDIGIVLNVTPRINKNDFVTLEVAPEAGSQNGAANFQGINIPIIDNRTASTTVLIKSGNTLAIGGLMRQDNSAFYTKVPVLGDIPGVGAMFRSKSLSKTKRDLLIFLTPTIVNPDAQTGFEKYVNGLPPEQLSAGDKWMPADNAKPNPINLVPFGRRISGEQNFTHR
jgi:type IV pilus assembly protein PilQ